MMRKLGLVILGLSVLLLSGCGRYASNIKNDYILQDKKKGLIFGSLFREGGGDSTLYISKKGDDKSKKILVKAVGISNFNRDFIDGKKHGSLFAFELSPGEYEVTDWSTHHKFTKTNFITCSPKVKKSLYFTVNANKITYIGSYNIISPNIMSAKAVVSSRLSKDKKFFSSKYKNLGKKSISIDIPNSTAWKNQEITR